MLAAIACSIITASNPNYIIDANTIQRSGHLALGGFEAASWNSCGCARVRLGATWGYFPCAKHAKGYQWFWRKTLK